MWLGRLGSRSKYASDSFELAIDSDRAQRALSNAIFAGAQFLELEKLQGFKVSVKKLRFRFSPPQRDGFSVAQVQS